MHEFGSGCARRSRQCQASMPKVMEVEVRTTDRETRVRPRSPQDADRQWRSISFCEKQRISAFLCVPI
jgi:hypothetical protein